MAEADKPNSEIPDNGTKRRRIRMAATVILAMALAGSLYWFFFLRNNVSTDDAYARADSAQVSSRIPGSVARVLADNDYAVQTGNVLVQLDPADYQVAFNRAKAVMDQDEADLLGAEIMVPPVSVQTSSQVEASEAALKAAQDTEKQTRHNLEQLKSTRTASAADFSQAERDLKRFESLYKSGAGTERQQEQARTGYDRSKAQLSAFDAQVAGLESALSAATQQVSRAKAQLQSVKSELSNVEVQRQKVQSLRAKRDKSKAELEAARLNLSYSTISAPIDGYVAQKNVQVGDRVQPGQPMMAIVPLSNIYVEANLKETQLTHVRIGQSASIYADSYPGYEFKGKVIGIRAGTGAAFSLIPPENATGNWIKVVQRIPVRIELDQPPPADHPLRVGASMEVTIDISDRSGPQLIVSKPASLSVSSPQKQ